MKHSLGWIIAGTGRILSEIFPKIKYHKRYKMIINRFLKRTVNFCIPCSIEIKEMTAPAGRNQELK